MALGVISKLPDVFLWGAGGSTGIHMETYKFTHFPIYIQYNVSIYIQYNVHKIRYNVHKIQYNVHERSSF